MGLNDQLEGKASANSDKLSLIDQRDGIVLWTEFDDHCDKLAVDCRISDVLSTRLTDDGPVFHALSVTLSSSVDDTFRRSICRSKIF